MSYIVKVYTMRSILGLNGFLNQMLVGSGLLAKPSLLFLYNQTAILITMAVIFLPFVILPIFLSLERIPRTLLQASSDLGAGLWTTFRHVFCRFRCPGTIAGALFAFVLALGDFITPQMVGGPSGFTFGRVIWSQFGLAYNWPFGAAMGVVLLRCRALAILVRRRQRRAAARDLTMPSRRRTRCRSGAAALLTARARSAVLYAPVLIGALFSVITVDRHGNPLGDRVASSWYGRLLDNQSILARSERRRSSASSRSRLAAVLAVTLALYVAWEGALFRRDHRSRRLSALPPAARSSRDCRCSSSSPESAWRGVCLTIIIGHTVFVLAIMFRLVQTRLQALAGIARGGLGRSRCDHAGRPCAMWSGRIELGGRDRRHPGLHPVLRRDADLRFSRRGRDDAAAAALGHDACRLQPADQRTGHHRPADLDRPGDRRSASACSPWSSRTTNERAQRLDGRVALGDGRGAGHRARASPSGWQPRARGRRRRYRPRRGTIGRPRKIGEQATAAAVDIGDDRSVAALGDA